MKQPFLAQSQLAESGRSCLRRRSLPDGDKATGHYGDIRAVLERQGQTIGVNGLPIDAHARSEGLVIVSNNSREFERVAGLRVENWLGQQS